MAGVKDGKCEGRKASVIQTNTFFIKKKRESMVLLISEKVNR